MLKNVVFTCFAGDWWQARFSYSLFICIVVLIPNFFGYSHHTITQQMNNEKEPLDHIRRDCNLRKYFLFCQKTTTMASIFNITEEELFNFESFCDSKYLDPNCQKYGYFKVMTFCVKLSELQLSCLTFY